MSPTVLCTVFVLEGENIFLDAHSHFKSLTRRFLFHLLLELVKSYLFLHCFFFFLINPNKYLVLILRPSITFNLWALDFSSIKFRGNYSISMCGTAVDKKEKISSLISCTWIHTIPLDTTG